jgi:hypothetical protein
MTSVLKRVLDYSAVQARGDLIGRVASNFYQLYTDHQSWTWACDVDIGEPEVLRNVPVATNNREIFYAHIGKPVALKKVGPGKYMIVGLAKTAISDTRILYMRAPALCTPDAPLGEIVREELVGFVVRPLLYEELDIYGGYGVVPYGAYGRFDADGNLLALLN